MKTKQELLQAVNNDTAKFINEKYICKDCWQQEYVFEGVTFYVNAYTDNRWLEEDPEFVEVEG